MGPEEALELARKADQIYASKGTKIVHIDMRKEKPDDDRIIALMIGPSGNLRAPTLQVGKTLLVGFNEESYTKVLN
jgi:arsenate reductase-like glutaredoxin family protein